MELRNNGDSNIPKIILICGISIIVIAVVALIVVKVVTREPEPQVVLDESGEVIEDDSSFFYIVSDDTRNQLEAKQVSLLYSLDNGNMTDEELTNAYIDLIELGIDNKVNDSGRKILSISMKYDEETYGVPTSEVFKFLDTCVIKINGHSDLIIGQANSIGDTYTFDIDNIEDTNIQVGIGNKFMSGICFSSLSGELFEYKEINMDSLKE